MLRMILHSLKELLSHQQMRKNIDSNHQKNSNMLSESREKHKPTSCEGYITKRGHFRKSWRVRYLVFNGADLKVAYYDSKTTYKDGGLEKGSFYLSNVEKQDYRVGLIASDPKPFGFKMVGHAPKKGYIELNIYVDNVDDLNKWIDITSRALEYSKKSVLKIPALPFDSFSTNADNTNTTKVQVQKLSATKEDFLKSALQQVQMANEIGSQACSEIVLQGVTLDHIEADLSKVKYDLNHADKLLSKMKHPMLHLFDSDKRSPGKIKSESSEHTDALSPNTISNPPAAVANLKSTDDLENLSRALEQLEHQAQLLNSEAITSNEQISRIEDQLTEVNSRVQTQIKKATAVTQSGNIF